jgi:hypothetical protein
LQIIEALITGADTQLVSVCARLTPGLVGSGYRPRRFIPVQFIVAGERPAEEVTPE